MLYPLLLVAVEGEHGRQLAVRDGENESQRVDFRIRFVQLSHARVAFLQVPDGCLEIARLPASDVLTRGSKDSSQPWENPETGARGSVTPLAQAYSSEGRVCRDFLASYVNGASESWLQGAACKSSRGHWEIQPLKPWRQG